MPNVNGNSLPISEIVQKFATYEEYLDSHITEEDRFYVDDIEILRKIAETESLQGTILTREEFELSQNEILSDAVNKNSAKTTGKTDTTTDSEAGAEVLSHAGLTFDEFPCLQALADRESLVRQGKLAVIIFIRDRNHTGQEVSGYIDYGQRLKTDNFRSYFSRVRKFLPRTTDLSFYNWDTQFVSSVASDTFEAVADNEEGFLFRCKKDRKIINVSPDARLDETTLRHEIKTHEYLQVVIFDHILRKKI